MFFNKKFRTTALGAFLLHEKDIESAYIREVIVREDGSACINTKKGKFQDVQKMLTQTSCNVDYANQDINYIGLSGNEEMTKQTFNILYNAKYLSKNDHETILKALSDCLSLKGSNDSGFERKQGGLRMKKIY